MQSLTCSDEFPQGGNIEATRCSKAILQLLSRCATTSMRRQPTGITRTLLTDARNPTNQHHNLAVSNYNDRCQQLCISAISCALQRFSATSYQPRGRAHDFHILSTTRNFSSCPKSGFSKSVTSSRNPSRSLECAGRYFSA